MYLKNAVVFAQLIWLPLRDEAGLFNGKVILVVLASWNYLPTVDAIYPKKVLKCSHSLDAHSFVSEKVTQFCIYQHSQSRHRRIPLSICICLTSISATDFISFRINSWITAQNILELTFATKKLKKCNQLNCRNRYLEKKCFPRSKRSIYFLLSS